MAHVSAYARIIAGMVLLSLNHLPLHAQEEPSVITAFYDTFAELGGERPTHDTLSLAEDGTITLTGMRVTLLSYQAEGEDIRQEMSAGTAVIRGVTELESGLFEVADFTLRKAEVTMSSPQIDLFRGSMPVIEMSGVIIRSPEHLRTPLDRWLASNILARSARMPLLTISAEEFSIDIHDIETAWTGDAKTGLGEWTFGIGSIRLPEEFADMAEGPMSLKDLGYETLDAGFSGRSSIALNNDLIDVGLDFAIILKEMGTFSFAAGLNKIQPALIETAQTLREAPETLDPNRLMADAQTIEITHFKLRYDDHSLVGRVLDFQANQQGKTREQLIEEAVQTGEMGLMGFNTPEIAAQARDALRTFLQNPGWIQFEAKPVQPVPVAQLLELFAQPPEVVKLLQISVTSGPPEGKQE